MAEQSRIIAVRLTDQRIDELALIASVRSTSVAEMVRASVEDFCKVNLPDRDEVQMSDSTRSTTIDTLLNADWPD